VDDAALEGGATPQAALGRTWRLRFREDRITATSAVTGAHRREFLD